MNDSPVSGPLSDYVQDWTELPDSLENRLQASVYLAECGLASGPSEDIAYRLTLKLAAERVASKLQYDLLSAEVKRYRERWNRERLIANDLADENAEIMEKLKMLEFENDLLVKAHVTAQGKLENALAWTEELLDGAAIQWDDLLEG